MMATLCCNLVGNALRSKACGCLLRVEGDLGETFIMNQEWWPVLKSYRINAKYLSASGDDGMVTSAPQQWEGFQSRI